MRVIGTILQASYRLRRHFWLGWSLARWIGGALFVLALLTLVIWRTPWYALLIGLVLLLYVVLLAWAGRRRYIHFEPDHDSKLLLGDAAPGTPLRPEEWVPTQASGWLTVEGKRQYYIDLEADFETVATREHIVLARVHPSRFLLVGTWPRHELGWWYAFFQPATIQGLEVGQLTIGREQRPAIRVVYAPDEKAKETILLSFDSPSALRRVWEDLTKDAPQASSRIRGEQNVRTT